VCVVYRTLARSTRDRPSADTGRVREVEGAGQLSLKQERTGPGQDQDQDQDGLLRWGAPGWAADDACGGVGPKADRSNRQSQVVEGSAARPKVPLMLLLAVTMGVACKQQVPE
jgi:hypothetical protein